VNTLENRRSRRSDLSVGTAADLAARAVIAAYPCQNRSRSDGDRTMNPLTALGA